MNNYDSIIISSRIRLARNLSGFNFPNKIKSKTEADEIIALIFDELKNFENYKVKDLSESILLSLKEKHMISQDLVNNIEYGALSLSSDETISIMINEEEHIREQCILKGFKLNEALEKLNEVDDTLIEDLKISYDENLGFLTTCSSNLGTGMRASVMMFLPGLTITNSIQNLISTLSKVGLTVRGNYGEGTDADGFVYQISNSQTLGISEENIINNVATAVMKICEKEFEAREKIKKANDSELINKIYRAYGILKHGYMITSSEATKLLSQVKFGVCLNILDCVKIETIDELLEDILPNTLTNISGEEMTSEERDIFRASYISKKI
ncbi:MAG: protein arginine kinase [Clostridiales bacterium]|nr:protein arginine kinase [Candidatus Apopatousia equi]